MLCLPELSVHFTSGFITHFNGGLDLLLLSNVNFLIFSYVTLAPSNRVTDWIWNICIIIDFGWTATWKD